MIREQESDVQTLLIRKTEAIYYESCFEYKILMNKVTSKSCWLALVDWTVQYFSI